MNSYRIRCWGWFLNECHDLEVGYLKRHGDTAPIFAAMEADRLLEAGDLDGAATWRRILDVYGRSPMFFYLAHIWLFMLIGLPFRNGTGYGILYLAWAVGMIPLYFACQRYTAFKLAKPAESYWRML